MIPCIARRVLAATVLAVLALAQPAQAQNLPKGEEILEKYLEATGGKAAHEKCKTRTSKGNLEVAAIGIKGEITMYIASPDKFYSVVKLPGIGEIEEGTDGKVVWSIDPNTGPRIKEGTEKESGLRKAHLDLTSNWQKYTKKAECTGEDTVDGKKCYKVEVTKSDGRTQTQYYEKSTFHLIKSVGMEKTPNGDLEVESVFSDYKKVDGVMLPFKTRQSVLSTEIVITVEKVEHNLDIPADRFNLPQEIKKLLAKQDK